MQSSFYAVDKRINITWQVNGWPAGLITGFRVHDTFYIEHVIMYAKSTLDICFPFAMTYAVSIGLKTLVFHMPRSFSDFKAISRFACHRGFAITYEIDGDVYFVRSVV